jgi:hypothetical protein
LATGYLIIEYGDVQFGLHVQTFDRDLGQQHGA